MAFARLSDFLKAYLPETTRGDPFSLKHPEDLPPYVSLETPDGEYYVGLDMESAMNHTGPAASEPLSHAGVRIRLANH